MDGFGAEIVSRETIRPSSPTPPHLRIYNLSLLDQFSPLIYIPCALFYSVNDTNTSDPDKTVQQLQHSLSRTLSIFYPLAGRFRDDLSINCNDEGVLFSVATMRLNLQEYLNNPDLDLLDHFTPMEDPLTPENLNSAALVAVQVTLFSSGGLAIGMKFLHRVADASAMASFLRVWAGIASGGTMDYSREIKPDHFMAASVHFPPLREKLGEDMASLDLKWMTNKGKSVRSRVVLDAEAISILKAEASEKDHLPNPTRFEVVTAFIWKHALAASMAMNGSHADQHQPSMMMVAVNLRPRTEPPMDKNVMGSNFWFALAHQRKDRNVENGGVGGEIRRAVKKLAIDLVGNEELHVAVKRQIKERKQRYCDETPDVYVCSSWCRFPFYEVDFSWGKPAWIAFTWRGIGSHAYLNSVILMDNKSGDGVKAWLILGENETAKLFSDA